MRSYRHTDRQRHRRAYAIDVILILIIIIIIIHLKSNKNVLVNQCPWVFVSMVSVPWYSRFQPTHALEAKVLTEDVNFVTDSQT